MFQFLNEVNKAQRTDHRIRKKSIVEAEDMESEDQIDAEKESEFCASSTAATLEYDDVTSRGKILLNKHNAL